MARREHDIRPDELERRIRERLDALGPAPRAELLHVLMLPDFERAYRIGEFWATPRAAPSPSSWIDCEEDRTLPGGARRDAAGGLTSPLDPVVHMHNSVLPLQDPGALQLDLLGRQPLEQTAPLPE